METVALRYQRDFFNRGVFLWSFWILSLLFLYSSNTTLERGSNSILSYTEPLKIIHVRHRKVWNVKRKKSHTCGIHMLSFFLHTLLKLSATQHTRWWGQRVATAAEDEEKKKKIMFLKSLISHFIGSLLRVLSWRKWRKWGFFYGIPL